MKNWMIRWTLVLTLGLGLVACNGEGEISAEVESSQQGPTSTAVSEETAPQEMPNLVGMDVADAEEILRDLNVRIERSDQASPEEIGTVLEQDPLAGDPLTDSVKIVVAGEPPAVPDVVGETLADAADVLEEQGFTVEENSVLQEGASDGEVLDQSPEAGSRNVKTVTLDVARSPVSRPFADMDALERDGRMDIEPGAIAGEVYPNSLIVSDFDDQGSFGYNLSKNFRLVSGTLGIGDNESTECVATVEFKDGGRTLGQGPYSVSFGEALPVDFSVAGVLRLEITYATRGSSAGCRIVFGDFRAKGLETEIEPSPTPTD